MDGFFIMKKELIQLIVPLSCAVEDDVFNAVSLICGEEVAWNLCYEDSQTFDHVREFVTTIYDGFKNVPYKEESA